MWCMGFVNLHLMKIFKERYQPLTTCWRISLRNSSVKPLHRQLRPWGRGEGWGAVNSQGGYKSNGDRWRDCCPLICATSNGGENAALNNLPTSDVFAGHFTSLSIQPSFVGGEQTHVVTRVSCEGLVIGASCVEQLAGVLLLMIPFGELVQPIVGPIVGTCKDVAMGTPIVAVFQSLNIPPLLPTMQIAWSSTTCLVDEASASSLPSSNLSNFASLSSNIYKFVWQTPIESIGPISSFVTNHVFLHYAWAFGDKMGEPLDRWWLYEFLARCFANFDVGIWTWIFVFIQPYYNWMYIWISIHYNHSIILH